jgi:hypothetical protein
MSAQPIDAAARDWCETLSRSCGVQRIAPGGVPYLDRFFASGWSPGARRAGPAIFLHHFLASDPAVQVHSHPWNWSASLILAGGYREERCVGSSTQRRVVEYRPGDVNILTADDRHRVDLLAGDCWTLFLAGNFEKPWAFAPGCA